MDTAKTNVRSTRALDHWIIDSCPSFTLCPSSLINNHFLLPVCCLLITDHFLLLCPLTLDPCLSTTLHFLITDY